MKPQVPVWVALTFLMLMMVLFAALIFMFQGRYILEDRIVGLEGEGTKSAETRINLESTSTSEAVILADTEATVAAMAAEAETTQRQVDELNNTVLDVEASATTAVQAAIDDATAAMHQPPLLKIEGLQDGDTIQPNHTTELQFLASDPQGIETIILSVNENVVGTIEGDSEPLVTGKMFWNSDSEGFFVFEATATDGDDMSSETIRMNIEVVDREARLRELVTEIQGEVEEIRGLEFTEPVTLTLYTEEELRAEFEEIFADDLTEEDARRDVLELFAFDFVASDYDLYSELLDLYSSSVLGFYDPDTKELVVVSDDGNLTLSQKLTLVHELNHALQDQVYGLDLGDGVDEEDFAFRALIEGESSLMEELYIALDYMSEQEFGQLIEEYENSEPTDYDRFPEVIINSQLFPYTDGADFVRDLYLDGRFERINAAWENPPTTSEQVLHLDLFTEGQPPIAIPLPALTDTLGTDWEFVVEDVLGEFFVSEYLDVELSEAVSDRAASGWGGDRYLVHWNEEAQEIMLLLVTAWDSANENNQFVESYVNYATRKYDVDGSAEEDGAICWEGDDFTCLYQSDTGTTIVRAPSRDLILEIIELLP